MKKIIKQIRLWIIKKLLHEDEGYTFTGFADGEPRKFYYWPGEDIYVMGQRCQNFYYCVPTLTGWYARTSRHIDWDGLGLVRPVEVPFSEWIHGILETINKQYRNLAMPNCRACTITAANKLLIEEVATLRGAEDNKCDEHACDLLNRAETAEAELELIRKRLKSPYGDDRTVDAEHFAIVEERCTEIYSYDNYLPTPTPLSR
jgi:hypothetical protein